MDNVTKEALEKYIELKKEIHKLKKVFRLAAEKYFAQLETANKEVDRLNKVCDDLVAVLKEKDAKATRLQVRINDMIAIGQGEAKALTAEELEDLAES